MTTKPQWSRIQFTVVILENILLSANDVIYIITQDFTLRVLFVSIELGEHSGVRLKRDSFIFHAKTCTRLCNVTARP